MHASAYISSKKEKAKIILLIGIVFFMLILGIRCAAQMPFPGKHFNQDSLCKIHLCDTFTKKRFGLAASELIFADVAPWVVDRYFRKVDYAYISSQTISHNLSLSSWSWDGDGFTTNQFGHPYHGSLFFSAFRANGYSFWQAAPAAFLGSYLWETFAENQPPAPNDFINTGFGGVVLGEMTYRLANKIINNRSTGIRRQASEILALLINPMNGLSRILNGKWGRVTFNSVERDSSKIYTEWDIGWRRFRVNNGDGGFSLYAHLKFLYGTAFENYKTPFSNISINAEFGKDDSTKVNIVSVYGSLIGWRISTKEKSRHLLVLSANYDYINNEAFFYSAQSIKLNLFSFFEFGRNFKISSSIGAGPVILAAVPDIYSYEGRYYDYCSGAGFHGNFTIEFENHFSYGINYRGGWLKTVNGNATDYFLHAISSEFRYKIIDGLSICVEPGYFRLHGNYKQYDDVNKTYPYLRLSVRYNLNIQ